MRTIRDMSSRTPQNLPGNFALFIDLLLLATEEAESHWSLEVEILFINAVLSINVIRSALADGN